MEHGLHSLARRARQTKCGAHFPFSRMRVAPALHGTAKPDLETIYLRALCWPETMIFRGLAIAREIRFRKWAFAAKGSSRPHVIAVSSESEAALLNGRHPLDLIAVFAFRDRGRGANLLRTSCPLSSLAINKGTYAKAIAKWLRQERQAGRRRPGPTFPRMSTRSADALITVITDAANCRLQAQPRNGWLVCAMCAGSGSSPALSPCQRCATRSLPQPPPEIATTFQPKAFVHLVLECVCPSD